MHPRESQTQQTIIPGWFGVQETTAQREEGMQQRQRLPQEPVSNLCLPGELPGLSHPAQVCIKPLKSVFVGEPENLEDGDGEHPRDATVIHQVVRFST